MLSEDFASGNSKLHAMDPRCKMLLGTLFSIATALMQTPMAAFAALLVGLFLLTTASLPVKPLCKRLSIVNIFIIFLWVFIPFSTQGEAIWSYGWLTVTKEGVRLASLITLKSNAIIMAFIALAATSTITQIGQALIALKVPHKLALLFSYTWRYIHVIEQEYRKLATAAKIRGFVPKNTAHTYKTAANLAAMVLVRSWDRAERVNNAMKLRGFDSTFHAFTLPPPPSTDIIFALTGCVCITAVLLLDIAIRLTPELITSLNIPLLSQLITL